MKGWVCFFLLWILPILAKYTSGWPPLEQHQKIWKNKNKNCTHGVLKIPISITKVVSIEISKLVDRRQLGNNKKNMEIDKLFEILNKLVTSKVGIMLRRDANLIL